MTTEILKEKEEIKIEDANKLYEETKTLTPSEIEEANSLTKAYIDSINTKEDKGRDFSLKVPEKTREKIKRLLNTICVKSGVKISLTSVIDLILEFKTDKTSIDDMLEYFKVPEIKQIAKNSPNSRREVQRLMRWNKILMFSYLAPTQQDEWLTSIDIDINRFGDRYEAEYSEEVIKSFLNFLKIKENSKELDKNDAEKSKDHALKYIQYKDIYSEYMSSADARFIDDIKRLDEIKLKMGISNQIGQDDQGNGNEGQDNQNQSDDLDLKTVDVDEFEKMMKEGLKDLRK